MQTKTNTKNSWVGDLIIELFKGVGLVIQCIFTGVLELRKKSVLTAFLFTLMVPFGMFMAYRFEVFKDIKYVYSSIIAPIMALLFAGVFRVQRKTEFKKAFEDIGFMGKDKQIPICLSKNEKNSKITMLFKSNIPLDRWEKETSLLQTALDVNILAIEQGDSKKVVKVTAVNTEYRLPSKADWNDDFFRKKDGILVVGETALGAVTIDLNSTPHVLVAGETGSGKSVILRTILRQLALGWAALFMLDFKGGVEFGLDYEAFGEVVMEREAALELLELLAKENELRLQKFRLVKAKKLEEYNKKTGENLSRIGIVCDEFSEMLDKTGASAEEKKLIDSITKPLSTIARQGRSPGINLLMGTQRPDANVLSGQIKNNLPVRICGRLSDKSASEIVLGNTKATQLKDVKGRFMVKIGPDTEEMQAYFFDDDTMLKPIEGITYKVMLPELQRRLDALKSKHIEDYSVADEIPNSGTHKSPNILQKPVSVPVKSMMDTNFNECWEE